MSDEEELQEKLGEPGDRNEFGALYPPKPGDKRRLSAVSCMAHGLDPDCGCTSTIEVELDIYHTSVLYPGLLARALNDYFANHYSEFREAFEREGVGL